MSDPAFRRWSAIVAVRIVGAAGAMLGILLLARAPSWPARVIGAALTLSAVWMMASVPAALARRWRSPR